MPLDATEIAQLAEAVKTDTLPDFLKPVAEAGYKLYNASQLENYRGGIISDRDKELYSNFESSIKEVSGVDKAQGEKATEYLKRAVTGMKSELTDLKQKAKEGKLTEYEKERVGQLESQLSTKDTEFKKERDTWQAERLNFRVSNDVDNGLAVVKAKLKKDLSGDVLTDIVDARINRFRNEYKAEVVKDGDKDILIYRNSKGETVNNENHKPANAEYILSTLFSPYFDTNAQQTGTGSGRQTNEAKQGEKPTKDTYKPSAEITTRTQLSEDLKRNGFLSGSTEFSELLTKYSKKSDGTNLPLGR